MAKRKYSYDVQDEFDKAMVLDLPFEQLNARGRKAKKRYMR